MESYVDLLSYRVAVLLPAANILCGESGISKRPSKTALPVQVSTYESRGSVQ